MYSITKGDNINISLSRITFKKVVLNPSVLLENIGNDFRDPLFTLGIVDDETIKSLGLF